MMKEGGAHGILDLLDCVDKLVLDTTTIIYVQR